MPPKSHQEQVTTITDEAIAMGNRISYLASSLKKANEENAKLVATIDGLNKTIAELEERNGVLANHVTEIFDKKEAATMKLYQSLRLMEKLEADIKNFKADNSEE